MMRPWLLEGHHRAPPLLGTAAAGTTMVWKLPRRRATYWLVEARSTTLEVGAGRTDGAIDLTIHGPLTATALERDGVTRRTLPELRLHRLRFTEAALVVDRLRTWANRREALEISLGCVMDHRGTLHAPTLTGTIADPDGNDIVFGDADLTSR